MRIGIDVRKLGDGGIGEYIRETLSAIRSLDPEIRFVAFGHPKDRARFPLSGAEWVSVGAGPYSLAEHFRMPTAVRKSGVDLFHSPHYVLPLFLRGRSVVTVHDLIHVLVPRTWIHSLYAKAMIRFACARASRVITVSETTARDLEARIGVDRTKVAVIPNGVGTRFRPLGDEEIDPVLHALGVRRPYVLFVGNRLPHKNVERLVLAWECLGDGRPDLVLAGRGFEGTWHRKAARGDSRVRVLGAVDDDDLVALYGGAELLAHPSLYEGFGLTVLEAFACGTPVLGPDTGAVPEIAGDAASLVSPHRVDMLSAGLYRLINDQELRKVLIDRGFSRVREFSWEEAAKRTIAVYREVLG